MLEWGLYSLLIVAVMCCLLSSIYKSSHNSTCIHICFVTSSKIYDNNYDVRSVNCKKETYRQRIHGSIA